MVKRAGAPARGRTAGARAGTRPCRPSINSGTSQPQPRSRPVTSALFIACSATHGSREPVNQNSMQATKPKTAIIGSSSRRVDGAVREAEDDRADQRADPRALPARERREEIAAERDLLDDRRGDRDAERHEDDRGHGGRSATAGVVARHAAGADDQDPDDVEDRRPRSRSGPSSRPPARTRSGGCRASRRRACPRRGARRAITTPRSTRSATRITAALSQSGASSPPAATMSASARIWLPISAATTAIRATPGRQRAKRLRRAGAGAAGRGGAGVGVVDGACADMNGVIPTRRRK